MVTSVKYAESGSPGAFADIIGWIDFSSDFFMFNGQSKKIINSIPGGYLIDFTITYSISNTVNNSNILVNLLANVPPVLNNPDFPFGNRGYLNIDGNVVLSHSTDTYSTATNTLISISDIKVTSSNCTPVKRYRIFAADGETTNNNEIWQGTTDGQLWNLITLLPPRNTPSTSPNISGIGTSTVTEIGPAGTTSNNTSGPVYSTLNPTNLSFNFTNSSNRSAVALGVVVNDNLSSNIDLPNSNTKIYSIFPDMNFCFNLNSLCKNCISNCKTYISSNSNNNCNKFFNNLYKGNLGTYYFHNNTIYLNTKKCIIPYDNDELIFTVISNTSSCNYNIYFIYNPSAYKSCNICGGD